MESTQTPPPGPWEPATPAPAQTHPFVFTGTTREYFGIWIVNILLTVLTLGVYSAWAKVRRQRYFYGNMQVAGATFDYHANPVRILIGRIIILGILIVYNVMLELLPVVGAVIAVIFLLALPWFAKKALRFNARVTSYRNVRFDFTGGYGEAFLAYVLGGMLTWASMGLAAPIASQAMWQFTLGKLSYGGRPIACQPLLGKLYRQLWLPLGILVGSLAVAGALAGAVFYVVNTAGIADDFDDVASNVGIAVVVGYIALIAAFLPAFLAYRAGTRNVALSTTLIDGRHSLQSNIHRGRFVWISITNLLATIASLGLARPWAHIRMTNYLAGVTTLHSTGALDEYFSTLKDEGSAAGVAYADFEGIDLGI